MATLLEDLALSIGGMDMCMVSLSIMSPSLIIVTMEVLKSTLETGALP
jgi:hypothetical protein